MLSTPRSFREAVMLGALALIALIPHSARAGATATSSELFSWPASLAPMGNGYPKAGDVCRRLGESPATADYLDHTATLIGCPGGADSANVRAVLTDYRAHVVGKVDGVTLISISDGIRQRK